MAEFKIISIFFFVYAIRLGYLFFTHNKGHENYVLYNTLTVIAGPLAACNLLIAVFMFFQFYAPVIESSIFINCILIVIGLSFTLLALMRFYGPLYNKLIRLHAQEKYVGIIFGPIFLSIGLIRLILDLF